MSARPQRDDGAAAVVPVYHWRGARPFPLDLGEGDTGAAELLALAREGDLCLLGLSREANLPPAPVHRLAFHAAAVDAEALRLTLADLERDGWIVVGRFHVTFTGRFAAPDFWGDVFANLWQGPGILSDE